MKAVPVVTQVHFEVIHSLVICDPCYLQDGDTDGGLVLDGHSTGSWVGEIEHTNEGIGRVVSLLRVRRPHQHINPDVHYRIPMEPIGSVGVDSGRMYAACLSDLPVDYDAFIESQQSQGFPNCSAFGGGVVASTGYGDGCYDVYANLERTAIEVRFTEMEE